MVSAALTLLAQRIDAAPAAPSPAPNISLTTRAFKGPACRDVHSCRTLWEILYSCLVTTFACTYLSYHPDVPDLTYTAWRIRAIRSCTTAISFLMPELVVAKAASQWWEVWKYDFPFEGWTRTHSYFTVMGGFIDSGRSRYTLDDRAMQRLTAKSHPEIISVDPPAHDSSEPPTRLATPWSQGHLPSKPWILVTESEILDKSKGDALGKLLTVTQIAWFIAQYLERWVTRRPRTHLEVMTLAYAALNILTYFLWWDKPLDVQEPIDISGRMFAIIYDRRKGPHGLWSILRDAFEPLNFTRDDWVSVTIFPVVGVLFGGVHCFAWHFPFPTDWEQTLWRLCRFRLGRLIGNYSVVVYAAARVVLLVLTFTCLRAPLPGIYEATPWTSYLPHFW